MYKTESLWCTSEIITTLLINYISVKTKLKLKKKNKGSSCQKQLSGQGAGWEARLAEVWSFHAGVPLGKLLTALGLRLSICKMKMIVYTFQGFLRIKWINICKALRMVLGPSLLNKVLSLSLHPVASFLTVWRWRWATLGAGRRQSWMGVLLKSVPSESRLLV